MDGVGLADFLFYVINQLLCVQFLFTFLLLLDDLKNMVIFYSLACWIVEGLYDTRGILLGYLNPVYLYHIELLIYCFPGFMN